MRVQSKVIRGVVVSDTMDKTRVVTVNRVLRHSLYHKNLNRSRKIFVHDPKNESRKGDLILAVSCRPLSRHKHFKMKEILKHSEVE